MIKFRVDKLKGYGWCHAHKKWESPVTSFIDEGIIITLCKEAFDDYWSD